MTTKEVSPKALRAFKIGARARKLALEGCTIEGYEMLLTCINEARTWDEALVPLLEEELVKYEARLKDMQFE